MDALVFLIFLHSGQKAATQLIQWETHYVEKFLKYILTCKFGEVWNVRHRFHHAAVFPHIWASPWAGLKPKGDVRSRLIPSPLKILLSPKTQPRLGQNPFIPFLLSSGAVPWMNSSFWEAELFIQLLPASKSSSSHFCRRQDTNTE